MGSLFNFPTVSAVALLTLLLLPLLSEAAKPVTGGGSGGAISDVWLGEVLNQLSPKVSEMGTRVLNSRVEPLAQGALLAMNLGKKAFKFTNINLGQMRPQFTNFRTHKAHPNRITVDYDMVYLGNSDIQVSLLGISCGVRDIRVAGRARMVLSPTISELPLAGGIQLFFITKPDIDFDFHGVAKVADLPLIKEKIKAELLKDLMEQAVYPGRVTIPLSFTADPMLIWQPQVTGILAVRLRSVTGLPRKGGFRKLVGQDKPDVFATIGVGGEEWKSKVAKNTLDATWEDWYEFPLEEMDGHIVEINLYDKDHGSKNEFLGYAAIDVKNFMQQSSLLAGPTTASPMKTTTPPAAPGLAYDQPMMSKLVKASLQMVPGRKTKYDVISGEVGVDMAWQPLLPNPGPDTSRLFPGATAAFLTLFVYSANNLVQYTGGPAIPTGHLPSAQVTVAVANYTYTSQVVRDSQQPNINMGTTYRLLSDWRTTTLTLSVSDTEKPGAGGLFGKVQIPMPVLVGVDKIREIITLDPRIPSQTITITAKLRFPATAPLAG